MFKGILTLAVSAAISATAFGAAEVRVEKDSKRGSETGRAEAKAAARAQLNADVMTYVKTAPGAVAKAIVERPTLANLFRSVDQVKVLSKVQNDAVVAIWLKFADSYANNKEMLAAVRGALAEVEVAGATKVGADTSKLFDLRESKVALVNAGKLMAARATIAATRAGLDSITLSALAIDYVRTGLIKSVASKDARELAVEIEGAACLPRGA